MHPYSPILTVPYSGCGDIDFEPQPIGRQRRDPVRIPGLTALTALHVRGSCHALCAIAQTRLDIRGHDQSSSPVRRPYIHLRGLHCSGKGKLPGTSQLGLRGHGGCDGRWSTAPKLPSHPPGLCLRSTAFSPTPGRRARPRCRILPPQFACPIFR